MYKSDQNNENLFSKPGSFDITKQFTNSSAAQITYQTFDMIQKKLISKIKLSSSKERDNAQQFRNANRFFTRKGSARGERNEDNQVTKFRQINSLMQNQYNNVEVLEDKITRNILLYAPKELKTIPFKQRHVSDEIKKIDQQIRMVQKAINKEYAQRKLKELQEQKQETLYDLEEKQQSYDFLTNPQVLVNQEEIPQEEVQKQPTPKIKKIALQPQKDFQKELEKLEKLYEKEIDKAYLKREYPGAHSKLKKKNPKLYITGQTNKIQKTGEPQDLKEHNFRIYNHEVTPCVPNLMIPSFPNRKDMMAQCIIDYLKDNQALAKAESISEFPKCIQNVIEKAGRTQLPVIDKKDEMVKQMHFEHIEYTKSSPKSLNS